MTLSSRKCHFLYKKLGALHFKVSPNKFYLPLATLSIVWVFLFDLTVGG